MQVGSDGLIAAYILDGDGGGELIDDWDEIRAWEPGSGTIWVHLDRMGMQSRRWIEQESGLDSVVAEALLADASRPRVLRFDGGLVLNLRGVNKNPGAKAEDMVSVKIWAEPGRIITARHRRLMAIQDIRDSLEDEHTRGPRNVGDVIVSIGDRLLDRMGPAVNDLEEAIDALDIEVTGASRPQRQTHVQLSRLRIQAIGLRRYLSPQRQVFSQRQAEESPVLDDRHRVRLRETGDRLTRIVEDLDAARERASVTQDDIAQRLSERMERATLLLSVVAAIFLPLGLLTGLWGMNTGGIPLTEQGWGFGAVVAGLLVIILTEVGWKKWTPKSE